MIKPQHNGEVSLSTAPVTEHHTWRHLLRNLPATAAASYVQKHLPSKVVPLLLSPVATLAYWIASNNIPVTAEKPLQILIIGAEMADYSDNGRWYALLGEMLGIPELDMEFTFVGEKVHHDIQTESHALAKAFPKEVHAAHFHGSVRAFFEAHPDYRPDILFAFHPDFYKHPSFFEGGHLQDLINRGTHAGVAIFSEQEQILEQLALKMQGISITGEPLANPFFMEQNILRWAQHIVTLDQATESINETEVDELRDLVDLVDLAFHHSVGLGIEQQMHSAFKRIDVGAAINASMEGHEYRFIFDYSYLDTTTGKIIHTTKHEGHDQLIQDGYVNDHLWHNMPKETDSEIDKIKWASQVKVAYLFSPPGLKNDDYLLKRLRERADAGCPYSALAAARWYVKGSHHIEGNLDLALQYAHLAGERGLSDGYVLEASTIINQSQDPQLTERALQSIDAASKQDNPDALHLYYLMNVKNPNSGIASDQLIHVLEKAVERHHHLAAFELGMYYLTQAGDYTNAVACLELAANYGHIDAAYNLGEYYFQAINQAASQARAGELAKQAKFWFQHVKAVESSENAELEKRLHILEKLVSRGGL